MGSVHEAAGTSWMARPIDCTMKKGASGEDLSARRPGSDGLRKEPDHRNILAAQLYGEKLMNPSCCIASIFYRARSRELLCCSEFGKRAAAVFIQKRSLPYSSTIDSSENRLLWSSQRDGYLGRNNRVVTSD